MKQQTKIILVVLLAALLAWWAFSGNGKNEEDAFASGNGRISATEINIAAKLGGRIEQILVSEGDFVEEGQLLAVMQTDSLQAQLDEAIARENEAIQGVASAKSQVAQRTSDVQAQLAAVKQREAELKLSNSRLKRAEALAADKAISQQELEEIQTGVQSAEAALAAAKAQVVALEAALDATKTQVAAAESRVIAAQASVNRIKVEIEDSQLKAPLKGRVQFKVAQPGEVIGAGGRLMNMIDLTDVSMTFFLPETLVGRVSIGQEARIILDALPNVAIPAEISYIASQAQFTPKTVETASERQKLMFKVRAQISPDLLNEYIDKVKTGLPGEAWVKLDKDASWPANLTSKLTD